MDININLKIKLDETPALLTTLNTFCEVVKAVVPLTMSSVQVVSPQCETNRPAEPICPTSVQPCQPAQEVKPPTAVDQPVTPVVPVAAPKQYTLPELQAACGPLMDAGKMADLADIMKGFGVTSLMQLPADKYGELAVKLRALGARL